MVVLWRHVNFRKTFARVYMAASVIAMVCTTTIHWALLIRRNVTWRRFGGKANVLRRQRATEVVVTLARPFKVRAGQYVYVWIPGVRGWSFKLHRSPILWSAAEEDGKNSTISLLIEAGSKRRGRGTRTVENVAKHCSQKHFAWVDGPYGSAKRLDRYDTVLMVATGLGIAAQIPYIREILDVYGHEPDRHRSVFVAWEVDDTSRPVSLQY